ncbi:MAG: peptidase M15A, partial [Prevotellaceae bacterium]|nr:peptidase M15A [Prevotellaceae bacterium]
MKYFTLQECAHSDMAAKRGIDNTPSQEHMDHIVESVDRLLDPLREAWGAYCKNANLGTAGIMISSGYCGPKLNAVVGGP